MGERPKLCRCRCHGPGHPLGVPVDSALEAAISCSDCRDAHSPALLSDLDAPLELPDKAKPYDPLDDGN